MEKYSEVICSNGEPFRLSFNEGQFKKGEIIRMAPSGFTVKVKKVYKFNLFKRILFYFGYDFKSMELEEVKHVLPEKTGIESKNKFRDEQ